MLVFLRKIKVFRKKHFYIIRNQQRKDFLQMVQKFIEKIENPAAQFRGAPFWAWNGKLEPEELRRQIRDMKRMGLGGFFMHSRVGLNTPYLSDEWFTCIRACIDEAGQLGMNAWLYDEDRWPSGAAGGLVTREHPEFRRQRLHCQQLAEPVYDDADLAWFAARPDGRGFNTPRRLRKGDTLADGEQFLRFYVETEADNFWYNGGGYLDVCNPEAVRKFIEVTHEKYAAEISGEFGKTVPGIFTDEPNYSNWTGAVPEETKKRFGYDILDHLPELFFNIDGNCCSRIRLNHFELMTGLFVNSFSRQIGEWCGRHGLQFTGHALCEDNVIDQSHCVGSAMRFYEYMQAPGIDLLTEHWTIYDTAKQCVSVAHQFGRKTRLSETYGCTGWDFPFMGHKALGDWQAALGINLRCQHLAWYTMEAEAKRDYPASISYQSPWYKYYPVVEDYYARLGAALSEGEELRDLLVVHPIESTWFGPTYHTMTPAEKEAENERLIAVRCALLKENIDFDYGDEEMMSRHARVSGKTFSIAKADYKAVVLPRMRTIRTTTLNLLKTFAENGGKVVYVGEIPQYADGLKSERTAEIYKLFTPATENTLAEAVAPVVRNVSIQADGREIDPVLSSIHQSDDFSTLFLCNTGMNQTTAQYSAPLSRDRTLAFPSARIAWKLPENRSICELNLRTGERFAVEAVYKNGWMTFETSFAPLESRLFIASSSPIATAERKQSVKTVHTLTLPSTGWEAVTDDPNVFVLDHPAYSVDGSCFALPAYVNKVDDHLRELLGKHPRTGHMCQPWCRLKETPARTLDLKLRYTFQCDTIPGELFLGIERPDLYTYTLNGREFQPEDAGFWCDRSMRKLPIPSELVCKGSNTLELHCPAYHELLPGLETVYLLGRFGVCGDTLTAQPETLNTGDWCTQGFQNYAGNLIYRTTFRKPETSGPVIVEIPDWRGVALSLRVNGGKELMLPWPPFSADISAELTEGDNTLEIKVLGHRRNSHGPFYLTEKWPSWTGPAEFKQYRVTDRQLVPCGLLEPPVLSY